MKKVILFLIVFALSSCTKDTDVSEVFSDFSLSSDQVSADGQSTIDVSVVLSSNADSDRRNVIFKTTSGSFLPSLTETSIVKAEYDNGKLTAKAILKVSTKPGNIIISVKPEFDSSVGEFVLEKTITAVQSKVTSIHLEPSSYGIGSNYLTDVKVVGILKNSSGKSVSNGQKVIFEDFLSDGTPAHGKFREMQNVSASDSKVSCYYSIGIFQVGTPITIKCTAVDESNNSINIFDSVTLTINQ